MTPSAAPDARGAPRRAAPGAGSTSLFFKVFTAFLLVVAAAFVVERFLGSALPGLELAAGASLLIALAVARRLGEDVTHRKRLEREILEVSELERKRVGQDLHDGLGQLLTGTSLLSKGLQKRLQRRSLPEAAEAGRIKDLIDLALDETRALSKGLFPVDHEDVDLRRALEDLAARVSDTFRVSCRVEGELAVPLPDRAAVTHLLRIAQEAVSNSIRHGRARRIIIELSSAHGGNLIRIRDDGVGMAQAPRRSDGMGLRSMSYRAGAIGATLEIGPAPGRGTVVTCRFL